MTTRSYFENGSAVIRSFQIDRVWNLITHEAVACTRHGDEDGDVVGIGDLLGAKVTKAKARHWTCLGAEVNLGVLVGALIA